MSERDWMRARRAADPLAPAADEYADEYADEHGEDPERLPVPEDDAQLDGVALLMRALREARAAITAITDEEGLDAGEGERVLALLARALALPFAAAPGAAPAAPAAGDDPDAIERQLLAGIDAAEGASGPAPVDVTATPDAVPVLERLGEAGLLTWATSGASPTVPGVRRYAGVALTPDGRARLAQLAPLTPSPSASPLV